MAKEKIEEVITMKKRCIAILCIISIVCSITASASYAEEKETVGAKFKRFWQRLFNYPAKVTEKSVDVVTDTVKKETKVITTEVKRVGEVTSGDISKTKELIVEPLTGTAETVTSAIEETVKIPVEAAKEEQGIKK